MEHEIARMDDSSHTANFYLLPTEVILQIASYLDINSLWKFSGACFFLRKIIFSSAQTLRQIILNFSNIYAKRYGLHTSPQLMPIISTKCLHDFPIPKSDKLNLLVTGREDSGSSIVAVCSFFVYF